mgnify:CR=1 FL=1
MMINKHIWRTDGSQLDMRTSYLLEATGPSTTVLSPIHTPNPGTLGTKNDAIGKSKAVANLNGHINPQRTT